MNIVKIARRARQALEDEVLLTPKPGLVDQNNSGAHQDMNCQTFLRSAAALEPWFSRLAQKGAETANQDPHAVLPQLRPIGLLAEQDMYAVTGGVNTHKGALFSLGLLCAAAGRLEAQRLPAEANSLCTLCAQMTQGITARELSRTGTNGLAVHAAYGAAGIRGEAESGFSSVRRLALPVLQSGVPPQIARLKALLALITSVADTNVLHRAGTEGLAWLQSQAKDCLACFSLERIRDLDRACIQKNISPGGCADLLAIALFLEGCF